MRLAAAALFCFALTAWTRVASLAPAYGDGCRRGTGRTGRASVRRACEFRHCDVRDANRIGPLAAAHHHADRRHEAGHFAPVQGDRIMIDADPARVHLFDPESGLAFARRSRQGRR